VEELDDVFLRDGKAGRGRDLAQQVIDDGRPRLSSVRGQILDFGRRVREHARLRVAAEPHLIDRAGQQGIEGGRDEQLQRTDRRQLQQRLGQRRRRQGGDDRLQRRVDLLDDIPLGEEAVGDLLQLAAGWQLRAVDAEVVGQLLGDGGGQRERRAGVPRQGQQILTDDRDNALLFDQLEQLIPEDACFSDGNLSRRIVAERGATAWLSGSSFLARQSRRRHDDRDTRGHFLARAGGWTRYTVLASIAPLNGVGR
jgi:hypothetical protein